MNSLIKILIYTALIVGVLSLLALFSLTPFGQAVNDVSLWLFSSILPLRGLIDIPAFAQFVLNVMLFETLWWGYVLANKFIQIYTGSKLSHEPKRGR